MIDKIGDFTIIAYPTFSGLLECRVFKDRCKETRSPGTLVRFDGKGTLLSKSIEDVRRRIREEFGCDTQSSLEDF